MNLQNCISARYDNIPTECDYCKSKATTHLRAVNILLTVKERWLCTEHAKLWVNGTLNV